MTRKDYILLAEALKKAKPDRQHMTHGALETATNEWELCVGVVGFALATDNPRFDAELFFQNCGMEEKA